MEIWTRHQASDTHLGWILLAMTTGEEEVEEQNLGRNGV